MAYVMCMNDMKLTCIREENARDWVKDWSGWLQIVKRESEEEEDKSSLPKYIIS